MALPGPDIVSIGTQTSRFGQKAGFWTAVGATLGVAVWSIFSLMGITALLIAVPSLKVALPLVGSTVLMVLGVLSLWGTLRSQPVQQPGKEDEAITSTSSAEEASAFTSLRLGFVTNISNPKALVFFTSFFTPMMNHYPGVAEKALVLNLLLVATLFVFCTMSVALRLAAASPLRQVSALRFLPGIIFIAIGLFYFVEIMAM